MILTPENYYSPEANFEYMSVSQFKDFSGTYGQVGCESRAMAKLRGEYQEEKTTALLVDVIPIPITPVSRISYPASAHFFTI